MFCEKPLALTRESAEKSVACDAAGIILGLGHERRFEPAMIEIKDLIKSGSLGDIMHVEANFSHDKLANLPAGQPACVHEGEPSSGHDSDGYSFDGWRMSMFGSVEEVYAHTARRNPANLNGDVLSFHVADFEAVRPAFLTRFWRRRSISAIVSFLDRGPGQRQRITITLQNPGRPGLP